MRSFTIEEYKKKYGEGAFKALQELSSSKSEERQPNFFERTREAASQGFSKFKSGASQVTGRSSNLFDFISGSLKLGAGAIETGLSPLTAALEPALKPTLGKGIEFAGEKIGGLPLVEKFATSRAGEFASKRAEDVLNLSTIAGTVGAGVAVPKVGGAVAATARTVGGRAGDIAGKTASGVKTVLKGRDVKALSIFTAEKTAAIESALKNPKIADIGIQGGDVALRKAVQEAGQASIKARSSFMEGYNQTFSKLAATNPNKLIGSKKVLFQFADDLKQARVEIGPRAKLNFDKSLIKANPGEATKIQAAYDAIRAWNDWTLEGTNRLKQMVGRLTKFPKEAGGSSKSPFLGKFSHYLDDTIKGALPEDAAKIYTLINKKFSSKIELYNDMVDAFNSGDPFKKIAQIFSDNSDSLRQLVDFYEEITGNQIAPIVAGRVLAQEKSAAFGFLNPRSWLDFFINPELQAKIVTTYGKFKNR